MSLRSIHAPVFRLRPLLATAVVLGVAACGGGTDEDFAAAKPLSVSVEGCVVDRHHIPTTGVPVRVLAADGRLLGNAQSDGRGRFTLRLPAQSDVTLQIDRPSGESLAMRVGGTASTWEKCLLDDQV